MNPVVTQAIENLVRQKSGDPTFVVGSPPPDESERGVWLFWGRGWRNGNFGVPQMELTDEIADDLLAEWIVKTTFTPGEGYSLWYFYDGSWSEQQADGTWVRHEGPVRWQLEVGQPFPPRWTTGGEFLSMELIEGIKAAAEAAAMQ